MIVLCGLSLVICLILLRRKKKTNIKFGIFYIFPFFNLLILVSLLLCVDLLAKFIFNLCFVF